MLELTKNSISGLRQRCRRRQWIIITGLLLAAVVIGVSAFLLTQDHKPKEVFDGLPHSYSFLDAESVEKIQLYMMSLYPDDVILKTAGAPLREIPAYGINGGFFYDDALLSIAIMNDVPVNGVKNGYGSGWFNAKYARGTLVWDAAARNFSVQIVSSGEELNLTDRNQYFAQGGISMNLMHEELWEAAIAEEHMPYADEKRLRSGMVYDNAGKLWLIVTPTPSTAAEFRSAVLETLPGEGREGIFLDGDGSSQMNADEVILTGDSRSIVQMIAVAGE